MPLFACSRCQTVENTALGDYWSKRDAPLCSVCSRGQWHGHFPQERADNGNWRPDSRRPDVTGFLERVDNAATSEANP